MSDERFDLGIGPLLGRFRRASAPPSGTAGDRPDAGRGGEQGTLGPAEVVDQYRHLRQVMLELNDRLVKGISKEVLNEAARGLDLLHGGTLVFDDEHEMAVLFDHAIHGVRRNGRNAVERYLEQSPPDPSSDELVLLRAMADARFSLFRVESATPGVGVNVGDLLRGGESFVVDLGLSETASVGTILAGRLISPPGFSMTTGAMLPVDLPMGERLLRQLDARYGDKTTGQMAALSSTEQAELERRILRTCLAGGASSSIMELDVTGRDQPIDMLGPPPRGPKFTPPSSRGKRKKRRGK